MNSSVAQLFFIYLLFSFAHAQNFCDDWETYKEEKCIKLINNANLQSFADAEKTCISNENSKLISIHSSDEQAFLENYLFKQKGLVDNIWLSAKSDKAHIFHWNDGHPLTFTNWAPNNPKVFKSTFETCLQMNSDELVKGKWANEPCTKKNLVVCERKQKWTLEKMQEIIEKQHEQNEKLQKTLEQLLTQNPIPIGFIYVQLPKEKSPQEIWSSAGLKWTDISSTYDSTFFRVVGNKAAAFGVVQEDFSPFIDQVTYENCEMTQFFGETQCNDSFQYDWSAKLDRKSDSWSGRVLTAHSYNSPLSGQLPSDTKGTSEWTGTVKFHSVGGEVRPGNMAVKVWKRTG